MKTLPRACATRRMFPKPCWCEQSIENGSDQKMNLPRHNFWGAGEPDCPPELKAPNGELCAMRCKVCGDGWSKTHNLCLTNAAQDVLRERERQQTVKGWTPDHDD